MFAPLFETTYCIWDLLSKLHPGRDTGSLLGSVLLKLSRQGGQQG